MKLRHLLLILSILSLSCGDDSEQAQADCDTFVDRYCTKVNSCTAEDDFDSCLSIVRQDINCAAAVETTDSYSRCLSEIDAMTCETIDGTLPASCNGAIVLE